MTHGVLYDFKRKLMENNSELQVLGNGNQTKTYFHVDDLVSIMLHFDSSSSSDLLINTGCGDNGLAVKEIAELVCQKFAPAAKIEYENSDRGWKGDSPISLLDTSKLDREYPYPKLSSREVVISVLDADV